MAARRCCPDPAPYKAVASAHLTNDGALLRLEAALALDTFDEEYVVMDMLIIVTAIGEGGPLGQTVAEQLAAADLFEGDPARFGLILRSMTLLALNDNPHGFAP